MAGGGFGAGCGLRLELNGDVVARSELPAPGLGLGGWAACCTSGELSPERILEKTINPATPAHNTTSKMIVPRDMTSIAAIDAPD